MPTNDTYLTNPDALTGAPAELIEAAAAQALAAAEEHTRKYGTPNAGLYERAQALYTAALYRAGAEQVAELGARSVWSGTS